MIIDDREIINKGKYDVIVIGGGIAGISAAVTASRQDLKVLLIEKTINLGGLATTGLISWYEPLCEGNGKKILGGMAEELIKLSVKYGLDNLPEKWGGKGVNQNHSDRYSSNFSPTVFSVVLDKFVTDNNVKIRFDTFAVYPVMKNGICEGVICESVSGREYFEAKVIIDATGDATIAQRAGIPTITGQNYLTYCVHWYDMDMAEKLVSDNDTCAFRSWANPGGSDMEGNGHPKGMKLFDGTNADEVTEFILEGKRRTFEKIKNKDKDSYDIMTLPYMPQFRTIRRIVGNCDFTAVDKLKYEDSIGLCSDFRKKDNVYSIPYGSLFNEKVQNVFAAGRIISATKGDGWEVARVIPTCALTGEAVGIASSLMIKTNCNASDVNINSLQKMIVDNGNLI